MKNRELENQIERPSPVRCQTFWKRSSLTATNRKEV